MKSIGAWILSILGVVIVGVIIDLILPSGRMNKYVKSIFAAVTVLVVITPLPALVKNGCSVDNFILNEKLELQDGYLEFAQEVKKSSVIRGLKKALEEEGISKVEIDLFGDFTQSVPIVESVSVNLKQVVILGQSEHINKYELVRTKISEYLSISKDAIEIYER